MINAWRVRRIYLVIPSVQINDLCFNTRAKLPFKYWLIQSSDKLFISEGLLSAAHFSQHSFYTVLPFFSFIFFFKCYCLTLSRIFQTGLRDVHLNQRPKRPLVNMVQELFDPPKMKQKINKRKERRKKQKEKRRKEEKEELEKERSHSCVFISCRWLIFICNCQAYHNAKLKSRVHQLVLASEPLNPMGLAQKDRRLHPELAASHLQPLPTARRLRKMGEA